MTPMMRKALLSKKLFIKKASNVQGSVRIHFPNPEIQDIILTDFDAVNVFGRIGITAEDIKLSNIAQLHVSGVIQLSDK